MPHDLKSAWRRVHKVRQACDSCHVRKIRCDGTQPCKNCHVTVEQCTYNAKPRKTGPKGQRKKDAFGAARKPIAWHQPKPQPIGLTIPPPQFIQVPSKAPSQDTIVDETPNESGFHPADSVSVEIIQSCLDAFFAHKYTIMPILDRQTIYANVRNLRILPESYGLITAICAVIVLDPEILEPYLGLNSSSSTPGSSSMPSASFLISETCRAREFCSHIEDPSLTTVQTSFFLFAACFGLGKNNSAWFYLRESMTMLQLLRLHEESTYSTITESQYASYCRRTFWLLFLTERAYAIQRHRPLTLHQTIRLPDIPPGPEATIISGFLDLISLFQHFDGNFISLWNSSTSDYPIAPHFLIKLQETLISALPGAGQHTDIQQADLLISRLWLKTMVWQLCVSKGLLSSAPIHESMSFHYPVTLARDIVLIFRELPQRAFEANGIGILEKVFDIGCTLADVLLVIPTPEEVPGQMIGPRDCLLELLRILGTILGGRSKNLRVLATKADECLRAPVTRSLPSTELSDIVCELDDESDANEEHDIATAL